MATPDPTISEATAVAGVQPRGAHAVDSVTDTASTTIASNADVSTASASTTRDMGEAAATTRRLRKVYGRGDAEVVALDDVDVVFEKGRFTAVMGPSGSGKSTLMHCVAGLDSPTAGTILIGDTEIGTLKDKQLTELRRDRIGFVFQAFNLVPTLSAEENIVLPLAIAGRKPDPDWYRTVIDTVDLGSRLTHKPTELSGGQQQRVACARALVSRPDIIFADEPTGNLDSRSSAEVLAFLRRSVDDFGQTIVMVTHDPVAASYADRALFLADGRIVADLERPTREGVLAQMASLDPREVHAGHVRAASTSEADQPIHAGQPTHADQLPDADEPRRGESTGVSTALDDAGDQVARPRHAQEA